MEKITISQALRQIKKLKGQLSELQERAVGGVTFKQSSPPAFLFVPTVEKMDEVRDSLVDLEARVAVANATNTILYNGKTVTLVRAVRALQELKGQIAWVRALPSKPQENFTETEYQYNMEGKHVSVPQNWTCVFTEAQRAEQVETLQSSFDDINGLVESANHVTLV